MSTEAEQPTRAPVASVNHLMVVIWLLMVLQLFTLAGLFWVLTHAQFVNFTLGPKPALTSSTTTPAAGECSPIASAHRSVVPVRRGPLCGTAMVSPNPLAGSLHCWGTGFRLLTGESNRAAMLRPHAAGQRSPSAFRNPDRDPARA